MFNLYKLYVGYIFRGVTRMNRNVYYHPIVCENCQNKENHSHNPDVSSDQDRICDCIVLNRVCRNVDTQLTRLINQSTKDKLQTVGRDYYQTKIFETVPCSHLVSLTNQSYFSELFDFIVDRELTKRGMQAVSRGFR